jgi:hypothetical protein
VTVADQYDDDDYDDEQDERDERQRSNSEWAELRQAKRAAKQAETKAQQAQRELAFYKAGLPIDDPKTQYFVKGYEGDLAPEAIKQAAVEAGFLAAQQEQAPEQQQAVAAQQRIAVAGSAGVPNQTGEAAALSMLDEAYQQGGAAAVMAALAQQGIPFSNQG